jgi:hypothetical protein
MLLVFISAGGGEVIFFARQDEGFTPLASVSNEYNITKK